MAFDGLLGQEQPLGDRAVAEAFGRELRDAQLRRR